jgi:NAD(P)-dependent dehydrogenase (short-subunit alcohol dehydrogenase family)
MLDNILGSVALVTGANRGLGLAFVHELVDRGAERVYAGARDIETVPYLPGVVPVELDVTDHDRVAALAQVLLDVDLVVNNAGISLASPVLSSGAIDSAREELEVNYFGPLAVAAAFAPVLRANGGGAVVNVLSIASFVSSGYIGTYAASKAAAWSLTNALRIEMSTQATTVVAVHTSYVDTDMVARLDVEKVAPQVVAAAALDAVQDGNPEVLIGQYTLDIKAALSRDQELIYPAAIADWAKSS